MPISSIGVDEIRAADGTGPVSFPDGLMTTTINGVTPAKSLTDYTNVVVVDSGGNGDYTTLSAALASIANASAANPYAILMMPGIYSVVNTYVGLKAYAHVIAPFGLGTVTIDCDVNSDIEQDAGFTAGEVRLCNLIIKGALQAVVGTATGKMIIDDCRLIGVGAGAQAFLGVEATPVEFRSSYFEGETADGAVQFNVKATEDIDNCIIYNRAAAGDAIKLGFSGTTSSLILRRSTLSGGNCSVRSQSGTKTAKIYQCAFQYATAAVNSSIASPNNIVDAAVTF